MTTPYISEEIIDELDTQLVYIMKHLPLLEAGLFSSSQEKKLSTLTPYTIPPRKDSALALIPHQLQDASN
jgi:hypothetical protein